MKHIMVVLTNAVEGQDAEFNSWYDDQHLKDVLGKGPFEAAQRFRFEDTMNVGATTKYRYLAIYEIEDDKLEAARDWILWSRQERVEAEAAGRTPEVLMTTAIDDDRQALFFTALSARREAPQTAGVAGA